MATTFGSSPSGRVASTHDSMDPSRIGGLARWSTTNRTSGIARMVSTAAGSSRAPDEEVVGESGGSQHRDPAADIRAAEPVGVRFVVDLVPDPDQAIASGRLRRPAIASPMPGSVRSSQPTTPTRTGELAAVASRPSVSATLDRAWTTTLAPIPSLARSGVRSAVVNGRRIAARSSVSHG